MFKNLNDVFFDQQTIAENEFSEDLGQDLLNLTFLVYSDTGEEEEAGKIIFSFPELVLKKPDFAPLEGSIDFLKPRKGCVVTDIHVGKSRISLDEIRNLEVDDIVILENSNINYLTIKTNEDIRFNVNQLPEIVIDIDNDDIDGGQQAVNEPNSAIKKMWDNLQVEVNAEFQKIKMSFGELKQITIDKIIK